MFVSKSVSLKLIAKAWVVLGLSWEASWVCRLVWQICRLTLCSILSSRSCSRGETCGRSGNRSGSFCTTWNSLKTFGALKGMRPNTKVYRQAPRAYTSVGRPLHSQRHGSAQSAARLRNDLPCTLPYIRILWEQRCMEMVHARH